MPKCRFGCRQHTGDGEHQVTEKRESVAQCTARKVEDRVTSLVALRSRQPMSWTQENPHHRTDEDLNADMTSASHVHDP